MSLCEDLYRDIILDHYQHPRGKGTLPAPTHREEGLNPVCGDEVVIELDVCDDKVCQARFSGHGCSISQASASMLTELINGRPRAEVEELIQTFKTRMTTRGEVGECPEELGDVEALDGVRKYPVRIKCALLAWTTLQRALNEGEISHGKAS